MNATDRYHRQTLLPEITPAGQQKLAASRILLVGCGALGSAIAQYLARAGVGQLRIVDRDLVDLTNLHRQVLFTESDALEQTPKALAAATALREANSTIQIEPFVTDLHSGNLHELADPRPDLIVDGTDNAQTRYLLNDFSIASNIPWIYGACIGVEGRVLAIVPSHTACLRCLYPAPPAPGDLPTCDTAGVLPSAAGAVAALQTAQALRLLLEGPAAAGTLLAFDAWKLKFRSIDAGPAARREDCPCCALHQFEFLNRPPAIDTAALCGRNAVHIRPATASLLDLPAIAARLAPLGQMRLAPVMLRFIPTTHPALTLSIFPDARIIVTGTADLPLARSLVARYIGQ